MAERGVMKSSFAEAMFQHQEVQNRIGKYSQVPQNFVSGHEAIDDELAAFDEEREGEEAILHNVELYQDVDKFT